VALVWERVQTDDRQHHMMADDRGVLGGQQVPPTVAKNARTWLASTPGVLVTSMTASAASRGAARPAPVVRSTPADRVSTSGSCPWHRTASTV
jgi:hypothetical protein